MYRLGIKIDNDHTVLFNTFDQYYTGREAAEPFLPSENIENGDDDSDINHEINLKYAHDYKETSPPAQLAFPIEIDYKVSTMAQNPTESTSPSHDPNFVTSLLETISPVSNALLFHITYGYTSFGRMEHIAKEFPQSKLLISNMTYTKLPTAVLARAPNICRNTQSRLISGSRQRDPSE